MALDVQIDLETPIFELLWGLDSSEKRIQQAINRANRKIGVWLNREVKRIYATSTKIPQAKLVNSNRFFTSKGKSHSKVWVGLNPIKAHYLSKAHAQKRGKIKVLGKNYPNAWYYGSADGGVYLTNNGSGNTILTIDVDKDVRGNLQRLSATAQVRFKTLLEQELNYALNVEKK